MPWKICMLACSVCLISLNAHKINRQLFKRWQGFMTGCDDQMALRLTRAWKCGRSFLECVFGLWALSCTASIKALNKVYSKCATINHKGKQEDQEPSVFIASFNTPYVCVIQQIKWYSPSWCIKCIAVCVYHLISLSVCLCVVTWQVYFRLDWQGNQDGLGLKWVQMWWKTFLVTH